MSSACGILWLLVAVYIVILVKAQEKTDADFLILGGGIAGLTAAKYLKENGINDYILLEGASDIGGRVKSVKLGDVTVEVGAQWIHNWDSPIGKYASKANLVTKVSEFEHYVIRNDRGEDISSEAETRYETFTPAFYNMHELTDELEKYPNKPDIPQRAALSLGGWRPKDGLDYAIEYFDHDFVYGHPPEVTSTRFSSIPILGNGAYATESVVTDQEGGMSKIIKLLRDTAFSAKDIRLKVDKKVTLISQHNEGVSITTEDETTYTGRYVIVTFSLGVLQQKSVIFNPPLPEWKTYSIEGATFVTDIPVYLRFANPFWDASEFILHANERRGYYTMWQNFNKLIPGSGILQAQLSGNEAKRISQMKDNEILLEIRNVLSKMYPGRTIPEPQIYMPRWHTDPLQLGSYTDWGPHYPSSSHDDLIAPVGRIYFAGEAYDKEAFGYMEGAYKSAMSTVSSIIKCTKGVQCEQWKPLYESYGCIYSHATNYDKTALSDDGSCKFNTQNTNTASRGSLTLTFLFFAAAEFLTLLI